MFNFCQRFNCKQMALLKTDLMIKHMTEMSFYKIMFSATFLEKSNDETRGTDKISTLETLNDIQI